MLTNGSRGTRWRIVLLGASALIAPIAASPALADEEQARKSLLRDYPTAIVESIEEITRNGKSAYKIDYDLEGQEYKALYGLDGQLIGVKAESGAIPLHLGVFVDYNTEHYRDEGDNFDILPIVVWDNGTFFVQGTGLGYRFFRGWVDVAAFAEVDLESGYDPDDSDFLEGLDDLDTPVNVGFLFEKETEPVDLELSIKADVAGAYDGFVAAFGVGKDIPLTQWLVAEAGAEITYYDGNYNDYFYGVDDEFALADRAAYEADGDFTYELEVGLRGMVFDGLMAFTNAEYTLFGSEVKNSPLVKGDDQFSVGIGFAFEVGKLYDLVF